MKILTRYVIRAHAGPFLFAFSAVTGLLFLNAVAQRLEDLAGKGLGFGIILEFMILSLPHIVALTFPMAILVAVLYTFSDMTGHNEVSAMSAGGIHPLRLVVPLLGVGAILALTMFVFNDRILPEANHRLSGLLSDVGSTSPTFELREEVVNEIHSGDDTRYFLRARAIDASTNEMEEVTIYDLSRPGETRTIVAERGRMAFTPDQRDLFLTLENGVVYEISDDRPGSFQRMDYETQILPIRGVRAELERREARGRSDREMTIAMLQERVDQNLAQLRSVARESYESSTRVLDRTLEPAGGALPDDVQVGGAEDPGGVDPVDDWTAYRDDYVEDAAHTHRINNTRWNVHLLTSYRYRVEVHKKYAIAFACLVFVLLGPPLAIRFPQGGTGMVIAASVGIFFFYWMGLIAGERFADRGQMNPVVAMWAPNAILLVPAFLLLITVGRQISTNRGSAWDELRFRLRETYYRAVRRKRPELAEETRP